MNWYYKISSKNDSSAEAFLARIGVPEETISFVTTIIDPQLKQQVIGYLTKFPQTPSTLLMDKIRPRNQSKQNANTPQEIQLVNRFPNLEFQRWFLVALRKARTEYQINKKIQVPNVTDGYIIPARGFVDFTYITNLAQYIYDWYVRGVLPARQAFLAAKSPEEQAEVINEYGVINANTNLAGLTLDQADEFAEDWHNVIAGEGEGFEYYGEKKEDIVFGPQWSDPKWAGWTIKKVLTKNNLKAEGNKIGNCVGSYCYDVLKGNTRIFSLRDPSNTPYVTMEVIPGSWTFRQIYGNGPKTGDSEPNNNLKAMIGEWMKTLNGATIEGLDEFDYSDLSYRDLDTDLEKAIYKEIEGYGLSATLENWDFEEAYDKVIDALSIRGGNNDGGYQTRYVSKILARAAIDSDLQKINSGYMSAKNIKTRALSLAQNSTKLNVIKRDQFDRMSTENKKQYLKEYIPGATEEINKVIDKAKTEGWGYYSREEYSNPHKVEKKIIERAYYNMSQDREFNNIKSFSQLYEENQRRFLSKAIDYSLQIVKIYDKKQENDEQSFDYYDNSYLDLPEEPDEDDFENPEDYKQALSYWEEERERIEDEAMDYYRETNLPYCLDDAMINDLEGMLSKTNFKLPAWVNKYFKKQNSYSNYPTFFLDT